ncbi:3'(2'),5'-bisphosphate nucleotidase CysQ [Aureisphaera sp. CAU 1614]|uniref:3'(2'),5'-bisphosphate nucleotidase CysQ n=1 Tax=Halomarinibacterium sedimenti TaxID=2857106 RepID=A0A9X1FMX9_9FLAO|nr:3'(2'),5'-bisphosphate nucleotidase CysQ [Halomarinibacterium sedimenti]MBW2937449.1 3'(2'),5'-bisphosphate nucleotidase CysQ [Halomarinibacterium sedimenti]
MKSNLEIAIKASIEAGKEILKIYNTNFSVEVKEDASPLTLADKNANDVINSYLDNTGVPIISEENKQIEYSERKKWAMCWIVDPLDGTKEFVKRNGEFTVNIALIKNGKPNMGVIYVPVSKELYFAVEGLSKAFKITIQEDESLDYIFKFSTPLQAAAYVEPIKIVGSRSHLNDATKEYISEIERHNNVEIVSKGSSLKFCLVAEGNAHLYPRFAPTMEWDTAAGQAICEAVGVSVIDQNTKLPLCYNKENLLNPHFLVKVS